MAMHTYYVIDKATRVLAFKYDAEFPIEWNGYPFTDFDHQEMPWEGAPPPPAPLPAPVTHTPLTQVQFLRLFTQDERIAMRTAATQSAVMQDYMDLLNKAQEVFLDDPDTINGVAMMEQAGILAPGRASEILNS